MRGIFWWSPLVLTLLLLGTLLVGASGLAPGEVLAVLTGHGTETAHLIVTQLRLPRALLGLLVGASLGVSGATLQATLRNQLAEPWLLGVSGGAAVGAVLAAGSGVAALGVLSLSAFGGAVVAVALVLGLSRDRLGARSPAALLMAGVMTGAFANAVIMVVLSQASPTSQRNALWWMMGSLSAARWADVGVLAMSLLAFGAWLVHEARGLDVMTLGTETATSLGVSADRAAMRFFLVASLLAAATVATAGLVGFVGLIVPHLARRAMPGAGHRRLLVLSAMAGGALVLLADLAARALRPPSELPLGAITALVGVPFFLWQLRRTR